LWFYLAARTNGLQDPAISANVWPIISNTEALAVQEAYFGNSGLFTTSASFLGEHVYPKSLSCSNACPYQYQRRGGDDMHRRATRMTSRDGDGMYGGPQERLVVVEMRCKRRVTRKTSSRGDVI
jgi:hypothetical protein